MLYSRSLSPTFQGLSLNGPPILSSWVISEQGQRTVKCKISEYEKNNNIDIKHCG